MYGALVEWYWQGKTEVLGEKHYTASVVDEWMSMEHWWSDSDRAKLKYSEKTCPNATFSTTNLTWTDLGQNLCLWVDRPATNHLSHGTATSTESHNDHIYSKKLLNICMYIYFFHIIQKYTKSCLFFFGLHVCVLWHTTITVCVCACVSRQSLELGHLQCLVMKAVNKKHCI
jgi:hypothetical protein